MSALFSRFTGFFVTLYRDRGRASVALVSALLLWILLGGEVEKQDRIPMTVRVVAQSDTSAVADGLTVRVPDVYAVEDYEPKSFDLVLKGTTEDLSRIGSNLSGIYVAPDNLLGTESRREVLLVVERDFKFAQLKALPNISIEGQPQIQLRVTKRERVDVALGRDNLVFQPESLGAGLKVEFTPSIVPVSGPESDIQRIKEDPRRLKIGPVIDDRLLQAFTTDVQTLANGSVSVLGADNTLHTPQLLRVNNGFPVRLQFKRERVYRDIPFKDVKVTEVIPVGVMRPGADLARPVSLTPETVNVSLRVPDEWFKTGDNAALRKALLVFVNVGDMQQNVDGQKLTIRIDGLPKGAEATIEPPETDVVWNIQKPSEGGGKPDGKEE